MMFPQWPVLEHRDRVSDSNFLSLLPRITELPRVSRFTYLFTRTVLHVSFPMRHHGYPCFSTTRTPVLSCFPGSSRLLVREEWLAFPARSLFQPRDGIPCAPGMLVMGNHTPCSHGTHCPVLLPASSCRTTN